jgi:hypothetical protein
MSLRHKIMNMNYLMALKGWVGACWCIRVDFWRDRFIFRPLWKGLRFNLQFFIWPVPSQQYLPNHLIASLTWWSSFGYLHLTHLFNPVFWVFFSSQFRQLSCAESLKTLWAINLYTYPLQWSADWKEFFMCPLSGNYYNLDLRSKLDYSYMIFSGMVFCSSFR